MNKILIAGIVGIVSLLGACSSVQTIGGSEWSISCKLPSMDSMEIISDKDGDIIKFKLDKDDDDRCHTGGLRKRKQRAEIYTHVLINKFYTIDFDVRYNTTRGGGSSLFQIHPGIGKRASSGLAYLADPFNSCPGMDIRAGFNTLQADIPGFLDSAASRLSDTNYHNQWHHVKVVFKASNGIKGVTKIFINGDLKVDSTGKRTDLCYLKNTTSVKLGLYRGKSIATETVEYKNISLVESEVY